MTQAIDLSRADTFPDMTPLPPRLMKSFALETFMVPEEDGDWAVSDSINRHRIWEPVETAVMSSAFAGNPHSLFLDFGAHVGWYTVIARAWGLKVIAWDVNPACITLLRRRKDGDLLALEGWIDETFELQLNMEFTESGKPVPIIAKLDIEGNERHVVIGASSLFRDQSIHIALIECSPVFNNSYPGVINALVALGYEAFVLPEKRTPPPIMDDTRRWLTEDCRALHLMPEHDRNDWVQNQHQFNAVFCLPEAQWG